MALDIAGILNNWNSMGVFSYVFPFLIIFAIVFAILQKTKIFGDPDNEKTKNVKGINAVIAIAIGFMSLLNNYVSTFFQTIFPRFGVVLAIFIVLLIFIGFFTEPKTGDKGFPKWVGWVLAIGVIIWAWTEWSDMFGVGFELSYFFQDYFWGLVLLGGVGALIYWMTKN